MKTKFDIGDRVSVAGTITGIQIDRDGSISYKLAETYQMIPEELLRIEEQPPEFDFDETYEGSEEPTIQDRIAEVFGYNRT